MDINLSQFVCDTSISPFCASQSHQQQDYTVPGVQALSRQLKYLHSVSVDSEKQLRDACAWDDLYQEDTTPVYPVSFEEEQKDVEVGDDLGQLLLEFLHISEEQKEVKDMVHGISRYQEFPVTNWKVDSIILFELDYSIPCTLSALASVVIPIDTVLQEDDRHVAGACLLTQQYQARELETNIRLLPLDTCVELHSYICLLKNTVYCNPIYPENGVHAMQGRMKPSFFLLANPAIPASTSILHSIYQLQYIEWKSIAPSQNAEYQYLPATFQTQSQLTQALAIEQMQSQLTQCVKYDLSSNRDAMDTMVRGYVEKNQSILSDYVCHIRNENIHVIEASISRYITVPSLLLVPMITLYTHMCGNIAIRNHKSSMRWTVYTENMRSEWQ